MHPIPDVELGRDVSWLFSTTVFRFETEEVKEGEAEEGLLFVLWQRSIVRGCADAVESPTVGVEARDGEAGYGGRIGPCCAVWRSVFVLLEGVGVFPVALLGYRAPVGTPAGQVEFGVLSPSW
jgi:hypothetical protein